MLRLSRGRSACGGRTRSLTVEIEVEIQHVYNRLTEKAKLSSLGMRLHQASHFVFTHPAFLRHAWDLEFSRRRRDVRVETRGRRGHQVYGHRLARIFRLRLLGVSLHPVNQFLIGRPVVSPRRPGGVVPIRPSRRRPRAEVAGRCERLPNDPGTYDLAVALDQLPVGLTREDHLRDPRDHERINQSQQNCRHDRHQYRCYEVLHIVSLQSSISTPKSQISNLKSQFPQANPSATMTISISLIPMKGM